MRALTMEEVKVVAGGDAAGELMVDIGEGLKNWGGAVSAIPHPLGRGAGGVMIAAGVALVRQGEKRNESTDGGLGGGINPGGGSGGPGNGGGGGSGGVPGGGSGGGGPRGIVCYGADDCEFIPIEK